MFASTRWKGARLLVLRERVYCKPINSSSEYVPVRGFGLFAKLIKFKCLYLLSRNNESTHKKFDDSIATRASITSAGCVLDGACRGHYL